MAKYTYRTQGDFVTFLDRIHRAVLEGSLSASYEDGSDFHLGEAHCAVRVYERYSMLGKNRVSLNITLLGHGRELALTAITSGGSQAVLFKFNTFGEEAFLDCLVRAVNAME